MIRPRRSLLFMPGSNARALEKARILAADGIILDLEDSVAPDAKALARDQIAEASAAGGFGRREVLIRVNSLDSPWWIDDVGMAARARPDGILVPKISTLADLNAIANRLSNINADVSIRVWAMIETARAVLDADKLAAASKDSETRLAVFVFGPNDISRETRIRMQPGRAAMIPMITYCILAARAHGLEILDGPYSDISNIDGFAVECAQGRDLGFDGKTLIHPSHIEACNAIFTPPAEEVEQRVHGHLAAAGRGGRAGAQDHRGIREAGKRLARRHPARRADGGAAACRHGQAHDRDCRCDRGDGALRS